MMYITAYTNDGDEINTKINGSFSEVVLYYLAGAAAKFDSIDFHDLYITNDWGRYQIQKAYRVPQEIIKENLLVYPIRYKMHLVEPSELFETTAAPEAKPHIIDCDCAFVEYQDYSILDNYYKSQGIVTA